MQHGGPYEWCGIALPVSTHLPQEEAFDLLVRALRSTDLGHTGNITQGIANSKHPGADAVLRQHLELIWSVPRCFRWNSSWRWVGWGDDTGEIVS
jgi:hypothetical protein